LWREEDTDVARRTGKRTRKMRMKRKRSRIHGRRRRWCSLR